MIVVLEDHWSHVIRYEIPFRALRCEWVEGGLYNNVQLSIGARDLLQLGHVERRFHFRVGSDDNGTVHVQRALNSLWPGVQAIEAGHSVEAGVEVANWKEKGISLPLHMIKSKSHSNPAL